MICPFRWSCNETVGPYASSVDGGTHFKKMILWIGELTSLQTTLELVRRLYIFNIFNIQKCPKNKVAKSKSARIHREALLAGIQVRGVVQSKTNVKIVDGGGDATVDGVTLWEE